MKLKQTIVLLLLSGIVLGQEDNTDFRFSGFADTYHALRSKSPYDFMSSRSRLRTELEVSKGKSYLFASINSVYNSLDESQTKIELREAFFQYTNYSWDLKAGKQIIIWGIADGMRITDIISPMDYSEFLARDFDDIRISVNAFRVKYIKPSYNLEFIFIPVTEFFVLPVDEENPWSITTSFENPYMVEMSNTPRKDIKNCEFGGRFAFYLSGIDFSVSALKTFNKMPVFRYGYSQNTDTLQLNGNYERMEMLGMDFSLPAGKFVFRSEIAVYLNELQEFSGNNHIKKDAVNYILGIDWYPENNWTITSQYYHKLITGYESSMSTDKNIAYATLGITKSVFRSTLSFSSFIYIEILNQAFFNRTSADISLTDQIHLMTGYDWFNGDKGMFSYYKDNSEFWIKAKYSF